ncbi:MAG TPA: UDP-3-O-(3-hydroxymyristoyl)glucosamine N-acyltransferase [Verrucomicrobiae bacterium]|jgi:UDP-3-O-[3-hydroxymyristoyl] glucosamine N-acyltransferase|nr:UDP-3-O-(3-hydroxymyristoyl)glucosamine N-acyltransferase [Verrucomicrobiae bacterium]
MPFTTEDIAKHVGGEVVGDRAAILSHFATIESARAGDLTFAENDEFFARAEQSAATAIIADKRFTSAKKTLIQVPNARVAFAKALTLFFPDKKFPVGIHPTAVVAASAKIDASAHVGPHCVIGERVSIGPRTVLQAGSVLDEDCALAEDVNLFPNVTLYGRTQIGNRVRIHANSVIGSDGFGYVQDGPVHRKVPQIGNVVINDDVEIGAGVTIDRGALGSTIVGRGTKIDNLVHIAHNVQIGEGCLLVAQVGIAGSSKLGNYVVLAGQVGVAGHLKIGNQAIVGAKSGVMHDIPDGEKWLWIPAQPDRDVKRQVLAMQRLPDLLKRVAELERKLGEK